MCVHPSSSTFNTWCACRMPGLQTESDNSSHCDSNAARTGRGEIHEQPLQRLQSWTSTLELIPTHILRPWSSSHAKNRHSRWVETGTPRPGCPALLGTPTRRGAPRRRRANRRCPRSRRPHLGAMDLEMRRTSNKEPERCFLPKKRRATEQNNEMAVMAV